MGNTDSIPVVSQTKSVVQLACGDTSGAARTQENFFRQCPGVSQVTSTVQLIAGDTEGALETQKQCIKGLSNMADGIPVVGHVKGGIHYLCGDTEGGHNAMKSATRTTGVVAGGAGGFLLGGPAGAVAGGIYGGAVTDMSTTIITNKPSGYVAAIENAIHNPNPGDIFDLALMPVADGLAGHGAGKVVQRIQARSTGAPVQQSAQPSSSQTAKINSLFAEADALLAEAEESAGKPHIPEAKVMDLYNKAAAKHKMATQMQSPPVPTEVQLIKQQLKMKQAARTAKINTTAGVATQQDQSRKGKDKDKEKEKERKKRTQAQRQPQAQAPRAQQRQRREEPDSDSSSSEEECTCEEVNIPVVFVNMQSINPTNRAMREKFLRFRALILQQPCIVAIAETWLHQGHDTTEVQANLGLQGYEIFRQDRRDGHHPDNAYNHQGEDNRRGGGILLAWRCPPRMRLRVVRNPAEDYADNIVNFDITCEFNCSRCNEENVKRFAFTIVYRPPNTDGVTHQEILDRLGHLPAWFTDVYGNYNGWCMVGDFNWTPGAEELNDVLYMDEMAQRVPNSMRRTHRQGNTLDYVFASHGLVNGEVVVSPFPISDHHALSFDLCVGTDYSQDEECEACAD